jgi:transposase
MRYELTDYEWTAIRPMLPNKPRGVPRVNDRRVLNGIFWILRSGAPWRDLPESFGPYTTCYNRFVRWRRAGVWAKIMNALAGAHDAAVQMIDTSIVRVHQHAACIAANRRQSMGRSRGGLADRSGSRQSDNCFGMDRDPGRSPVLISINPFTALFAHSAVLGENPWSCDQAAFAMGPRSHVALPAKVRMCRRHLNGAAHRRGLAASFSSVMIPMRRQALGPIGRLTAAEWAS